ncbi:hypothetical protein ABTX81_30760 [Kitasatospora sp. NPDC097605]|uniref:hypothetical protein n=1 Tax=Kitasatospora sp. NPDC097605 TaxID=3157226 RepID=UPI00331EA85C
MRKDLRVLVKKLTAQGFEVQATKNNHHVVRKDGRRVAHFGSTPSDPRAMANLLASLKRAGFKP